MLRFPLYDSGPVSDNEVMTDSEEQRQVPWGAAFIRQVEARLWGETGAKLGRALFSTRVSPVPCPKCGAVLAVVSRADHCLYRPGGKDEELGAMLSSSPTANTSLTCEACRATYPRTSGRGVMRRLRKGLPALG